MYITRLHARNIKLLRSLTLDFTHEGAPRMWTVFVAESGACKTTLLQAIALAASGTERANQLADVASLPDMRQTEPVARLSADFQFGTQLGRWRRYPEPNLFATSREILRLRSSLEVRPGSRTFSGDSWFAPREVLASVRDEAPQLNAETLLTSFRGKPALGGMSQLKMGLSSSDSTFFWQMLSYAFTRKDQISEARARAFPGWFVAGYGTQRHLSAPAATFGTKDRLLSRLEPLFGKASVVGTDFANTFTGTHYLESFIHALRTVLVDNHLLPYVEAVELSGTTGAGPPGELFRSHGCAFSLSGQNTTVPAPWLSQGYQSTLSWLADFIGQMFIDVGRPIPLADMEGLVLIDELDLHLHPSWQARLVPVLKRVFPRIQFIVTTHSPMLLPALEPHEVVTLRLNEKGDVVAGAPPVYPPVMTEPEFQSDISTLRSVYPGERGEELRRYTWLSSDPSRTEEQEAEMWRLQKALTEVGLDLGLPPVSRHRS